MKKPKNVKGDFAIDRQLKIQTSAIEEWEDGIYDYHRSEPTPYRALDHFFQHYLPLPQAKLLDYGSGLGRINIYFYDRLNMPGIGLELHPVRCQAAYDNKQRYADGRGLSVDDLPIEFLQVKAEQFLVPPELNTFYFFHPFSDYVFSLALDQICQSIRQHDRLADIILYYPSFGYFQSLQASGLFDEFLFVDCDWNDDIRDGFWVFRHRS